MFGLSETLFYGSGPNSPNRCGASGGEVRCLTGMTVAVDEFDATGRVTGGNWRVMAVDLAGVFAG